MGTLEVSTIIFIILKLAGVITWSWWIVLLPLIIALGIYVITWMLSIVGIVRTKRKIDKAFDDDFFKQ